MKKPLLILLSFIPMLSICQDKEEAKNVKHTFRDTRAYINHTIMPTPKKNLGFHIAHRFGKLDGGYGTFFGMDDFANIQLALDYGITDKLSVGISRIRYRRIHDVYLKYLTLNQKTKGMPISLSLMGYCAYDGFDYSGPESEVISTSDRLSFMLQAMVARKFGDLISLQLAPQYIHRNLVPSSNVSNEAIALNSLFRINAWGVSSFQVEYQVEFSDYLSNNQVLSFGVNFETKRHNFALLFSNATTLSQTYVWSNREISPISIENFHFGFNINRRFQL